MSHEIPSQSNIRHHLDELDETVSRRKELARLKNTYTLGVHDILYDDSETQWTTPDFFIYLRDEMGLKEGDPLAVKVAMVPGREIDAGVYDPRSAIEERDTGPKVISDLHMPPTFEYANPLVNPPGNRHQFEDKELGVTYTRRTTIHHLMGSHDTRHLNNISLRKQKYEGSESATSRVYLPSEPIVLPDAISEELPLDKKTRAREVMDAVYFIVQSRLDNELQVSDDSVHNLADLIELFNESEKIPAHPDAVSTWVTALITSLGIPARRRYGILYDVEAEEFGKEWAWSEMFLPYRQGLHNHRDGWTLIDPLADEHSTYPQEKRLYMASGQVYAYDDRRFQIKYK